MENNRYKRLTKLFINRVRTIQIFKALNNEERSEMNIYRKDSDISYNYIFCSSINSRNRYIYNNDIKTNQINYKLSLSKKKNLAILFYYFNCPFFNKKNDLNVFIINVIKKYGIKKYDYNNISDKFTLKMKIDEDIELSKIFSMMEELQKIEYIISNYLRDIIISDDIKGFILMKLKEENEKQIV